MMQQIQKKIQHYWLVSAILIFVCVNIACTIYTKNSNTINIRNLDEGFFDDNSIQIIVIAHPEMHLKGLVTRRESARTNAENFFTQLLAQRIVDYRKTHFSSCKDVSYENLFTQSKKFLLHAKKIAEYYKDDESLAVIVHIHQKNLKQLFNCTQID